MRSSNAVAWTSLVLFLLAILLLLATVLLPAIGLFEDLNAAAFLLVIGGLSLISSVLGFVSFRRPQGKIGAIGGLILFALVLWVTPISSVRG